MTPDSTNPSSGTDLPVPTSVSLQSQTATQEQTLPHADWKGKIDEVIYRRQSNAPVMLAFENEVQHLLQALDGLSKRAPDFAASRISLESDEFTRKAEVEATRREVAKRIGQLRERIEKCRDVVAPLKKRLERKTLNIVVIGVARAGKSLTLRTISGLSEKVIPDREGNPCTGVRSVIEHKEGATSSATVYFRDESSMLKDIGRYWEAIKLTSQPPTRLDDFRKIELPLSPPQIDYKFDSGGSNIAVAQELLEQLRALQKNMPTLKQWIGADPLRDVGEQEISRYVTLPVDANAADAQNNLHSVIHEVRIERDFGDPLLGKITFIDLPGLGDTTVGDEERMVETLSNEADVALFIIYPAEGAYPNERKLVHAYGVCEDALGQYLPLNRWAYLVINQAQEQGGRNNVIPSTRFVRDLENEWSRQPDGSKSQYFGYTVCNCSVPDEVQQKIMHPILDYLFENIEKLDADFAKHFTVQMRSIQDDVSAMLDSWDIGEEDDEDSVNDNTMARIWDLHWQQFCAGLTSLTNKLDDAKYSNESEFQNLVENCLAGCRTHVEGLINQEETKTKIKLLRLAEGSNITPITHILTELRVYLAEQLMALDSGLDKSLTEAKKNIVDTLKDKDFGKLHSVLGAEDDPLVNLEALERMLPEPTEIESTHVRTALQNLRNFRMSARGLIGAAVRLSLKDLETLSVETKLAEKLTIELEQRRKDPIEVVTLSDDEYIKFAQSCLTRLVTERLNFLQKELANEYSKPNQCKWAIVADFRDVAINSVDAEKSWRHIYRNQRLTVWPGFFAGIEGRRQSKKLWRAALSKVRENNRLDALAIIHERYAGTTQAARTLSKGNSAQAPEKG